MGLLQIKMPKVFIVRWFKLPKKTDSRAGLRRFLLKGIKNFMNLESFKKKLAFQGIK